MRRYFKDVVLVVDEDDEGVAGSVEDEERNRELIVNTAMTTAMKIKVLRFNTDSSLPNNSWLIGGIGVRWNSVFLYKT